MWQKRQRWPGLPIRPALSGLTTQTLSEMTPVYHPVYEASTDRFEGIDKATLDLPDTGLPGLYVHNSLHRA